MASKIEAPCTHTWLFPHRHEVIGYEIKLPKAPRSRISRLRERVSSPFTPADVLKVLLGVAAGFAIATVGTAFLFFFFLPIIPVLLAGVAVLSMSPPEELTHAEQPGVHENDVPEGYELNPDNES